jgi:hypothetical protein
MQLPNRQPATPAAENSYLPLSIINYRTYRPATIRIKTSARITEVFIITPAKRLELRPRPLQVYQAKFVFTPPNGCVFFHHNYILDMHQVCIIGKKKVPGFYSNASIAVQALFCGLTNP